MKISKFPPRVQIELCNVCNGGCITCPIPKMKRKPEIMDFELFKKIIDELVNKNFKGEIYPFLHGESLLIPDIIDYLIYIKEKLPESYVVLFTNGSMLNSQISEVIIRNDLIDQLVISIDGGTKDSFESIRTNLSFETINRNTKGFLDIKKELKRDKPEVLINMVITPKNKYSKKYLEEEFENVDGITFSSMDNFAGQLNKENMASNSKIKFITFKKSNFCLKLNEYIHILSNGDVCLCCYDYEGKEILGNIKKDSIQEIWCGEEIRKRRYYLEKRMFSNLPLCRNCDHINHNIISQQLVKILPTFQKKFPVVSKYFIDLYSKII